MTTFGWILTVLFTLALFSSESSSKSRVAAILLIGGILLWGTGTGL